MPRFLLPLLLAVPGCVFLYAPGAPAPGRTVPTTEKGAWDFTLDVDMARNVADGVDVQHDGTLEGTTQDAPVWPVLDLGFGTALADGVGLEAGLTGSLLLPLPFPIPNGVTLAPVFRLTGPGDVRLHTSPRFIYTAGQITVAFEGSETVKAKGYGVELPFILTWMGEDWVALNSTFFARAFYMQAVHDITDEDGVLDPGEPAHWLATGGGLTLNALFTWGAFRLGLGFGLEVVPNPSAGLTPCDGCADPAPIYLVPQGGITIGAARVVRGG